MSDIKTFRSTGVNLIAWVSVAILAGLMIFIGLNIPDSMKFTLSGNIVMWLLIASWAVLAYGVSRSRVTADPESIEIVNGFRTHRFVWAEVAAISMQSGAPWPTLITVDERNVILFGLQGSEGKPTQRAIEWLREHIS